MRVKQESSVWMRAIAGMYFAIGCAGGPIPDGTSGDATNVEIMAVADQPAIGGYDPVSYFLDGKPRKGSAQFSHDWRDATWWFATAAHRDSFAEEPTSFAPVYGGWCAYGLAEGYAAQTDPVNAWTIHDGKLYLNWDAEVAEQWRSELDSLLTKSEANWPEIRRDLQQGKSKIYWHEDE